MNFKIIALLFSFVFMQSCDKDPVIDPSPNTPIEFDAADVEVLVKNGALGLSTDCIVPNPENCEAELISMQVCVDCELCKNDAAYEEISFVEILVEDHETRILNSYGIFPLDDNYELSTSLCVAKRVDQNSHIVAFNLFVSDASPRFDDVAFSNVDLSIAGPITISKTITNDQFDDTACTDELKVVFSDDPNADENIGRAYTSCLIGSRGDCNSHSPIQDAANWEDQIEVIRGNFSNLFSSYPNSTPCSGIFIQFQ